MKNSLNSLAVQICTNFELVFVDYGSDLELRGQTKTLVESYSFAKYTYNETAGWFWSRAHAFNTGIKLAIGDVCILWDTDFIAEPGFLQKLLEYNFNTSYLMIACLYLPEIHHLTYGSFEQIKHLAVLGSGGICIVNIHTLLEIEGFDEFYQVWGAEDDDLYNRLQQRGLERKRIDADTLPVYHQFHPTQAPALPDFWYIAMVEKLFSDNAIKQTGFGQLFTAQNRPALQAYITNTYTQGSAIEFSLSNRTLLFNSLISGFNQASQGKLLYISFQFPQTDTNPAAQKIVYLFNNTMLRVGRNFRLTNRKQTDLQQLKNAIFSFLKYYVGSNRNRIEDYYLDWNEKGCVFILIKKV